MKTNVSIKFNSIKEYREIEKKLIELGYVNDEYWNEDMLKQKIMLDYKKLRKEFKEVLSKIGEAEIESWLKFDEERMMNESFIKEI